MWECSFGLSVSRCVSWPLWLVGVYIHMHMLCRAHFLPLRVLVFRLHLLRLLLFSLPVLNPEEGITHSMPTHEGEQWRRVRARRLQRWLISKTFRTKEKGQHLAVLFQVFLFYRISQLLPFPVVAWGSTINDGLNPQDSHCPSAVALDESHHHTMCLRQFGNQVVLVITWQCYADVTRGSNGENDVCRWWDRRRVWSKGEDGRLETGLRGDEHHVSLDLVRHWIILPLLTLEKKLIISLLCTHTYTHHILTCSSAFSAPGLERLWSSN